MLIPCFTLILVISLLYLEALIIKKRVRRIKFRIHVNGTRGKSSVTEYIAAGIRTERNVLAKITGIKPTIIYPDGANKIIKRNGRARVKEQFAMVHLASKLSADSLVLECMSILPELQILESKILSPHIYIITNIRDDHREEMGVSLIDQAEAICSAIPYNATVLTTEQDFLPLIQRCAAKRNSKVNLINALDEKYSFQIPDGIFPLNIALAIAACKIVGINEDTGFNKIMEIIKNKPLPLIEFNANGKKIKFVDGFAVNDVPSAEGFIRYWKSKFNDIEDILLILNTRNDRPVRSLLFAEWIGKSKTISKIILTGTHIPRTKKEIVNSGFDSNKIYAWKKSEVSNVLASLSKIITKNSLVFGIGNIAGDGFSILESLNNSKVNNGN
jgi:gamma-polyglutamate synthase